MKHIMNKDRRERLIKLKGDRCLNCGSKDDIEWHHVVPLEIGGYDIDSNMVPLCHGCHLAVTYHQLLLFTAGRVANPDGRPIDRPEHCDEIFEDYIRCRISKTEAQERLGKDKHFIEMRAFFNFKKEHDIADFENLVGMYLYKHDEIPTGIPLGFVKYNNGNVEILYSGAEMPKSGLSSIKYNSGVPELKWMNLIDKHYKKFVEKPIRKLKKAI